MSLICGESGKSITYRSTFYAVTRKDNDNYTAVLERIIKKIPQNARRTKPCKRGEKGLDIHLSGSSAGPTRGGSYSRGDGFELGEFQFSVSEATVEQLLPRLYKRYCQPKAKTQK